MGSGTSLQGQGVLFPESLTGSGDVSKVLVTKVLPQGRIPTCCTSRVQTAHMEVVVRTGRASVCSVERILACFSCPSRLF